jgi:actin-like ATPase involved in cell morphogenesis
MTALPQPALPPTAPAESPAVLRVGLDLGYHRTVFQGARGLPDLLVPRTTSLPTLVGRPVDDEGKDVDVVIGSSILDLSRKLRIYHPLRAGDAEVTKDFAAALRCRIDPNGDRELWGLVSCPYAQGSKERELLRLLASELFDRTKLMDPAVLMATSFGSHEAARSSLWIDVGARAVRLAAIFGGSPEPSETCVVAGGGHAITERLQKLLLSRYPDLFVSDLTTDRILMQLGHVAPAAPSCRVRLRFRGLRRSLDVAALVKAACEPLVEEILGGLRTVFSACPSDSVEDLFACVVVVGGGSRIAGLAERLRLEMEREFGHQPRLRFPEDPTALIANGALRWAFFLREEEWEIPLFVLGGR